MVIKAISNIILIYHTMVPLLPKSRLKTLFFLSVVAVVEGFDLPAVTSSDTKFSDVASFLSEINSGVEGLV